MNSFIGLGTLLTGIGTFITAIMGIRNGRKIKAVKTTADLTHAASVATLGEVATVNGKTIGQLIEGNEERKHIVEEEVTKQS